MSARVSIDDLEIHAPNGGDQVGRSLVWCNTSDVDLPKTAGGDDVGRLMVRFAVDGTFDAVYGDLGQTGALTALRRGVLVLSELLEHMEKLAQAVPLDPGRCLVHDDWGRCLEREGHTSEHRYPREESVRRALGQIPPKDAA